MSEDEAKRAGQEEEGDETEAHRKPAANEEPAAEGEGDDEVEAHAHKHL
jgi:hypothetical protein